MIVKVLKHLTSQPFVVATGFAALIHSTWSLGTFFSGEQPAEPMQLILWLIPALLIAFSLDVGQIVTSAEIRAGQRSWQKYATFLVFALATYYLQFVYISSHMPSVNLAPGIRNQWGDVVGFIRDLGVFIIPALLPLSTLLYTFSQENEPLTPSAETSSALTVLPQDDPTRITIETPVPRIEIECDQCAWAGSYKNQTAANNALTAHRKIHSLVSSKR